MGGVPIFDQFLTGRNFEALRILANLKDVILLHFGRFEELEGGEIVSQIAILRMISLLTTLHIFCCNLSRTRTILNIQGVRSKQKERYDYSTKLELSVIKEHHDILFENSDDLKKYL